MTNSLLRACCFMTLLSMGCRMQPSSSERKYQSLLDQKDFFRLQSMQASDTDGLSPQKKLYFQAYIDNAFNRNDASNKAIETLLGRDSSSLPDSLKAKLLQLQQDNDFKTCKYAMASATDRQLLSRYRAQLDSSTADDISNQHLIDSGLAAVSPQQMTLPDSAVIPWHKDKVGLIEIQARMRDSSVSSIFDTRANISSINETYAKKLGVHLLGTKYKEGSGITGNTFQVALGVADSLWLGAVLLQHVVFQVMPDSILYIAPIDFRMNIIIGYPVIAQLREIHILRNGSMIMPAQPTPSTLHNLAMDGLNPMLSCIVGKDTLIFKFDTGASGTDFFDTYYRRYTSDVQQHGKADSVMSGGAGGVVRQKVYFLKNIKLAVGSKTATLSKVTVHSDPIPNQHEVVYGNLGQDLMQQFDEMILNFDSMYIDFK